MNTNCQAENEIILDFSGALFWWRI